MRLNKSKYAGSRNLSKKRKSEKTLGIHNNKKLTEEMNEKKNRKETNEKSNKWKMQKVYT